MSCLIAKSLLLFLGSSEILVSLCYALQAAGHVRGRFCSDSTSWNDKWISYRASSLVCFHGATLKRSCITSWKPFILRKTRRYADRFDVSISVMKGLFWWQSYANVLSPPQIRGAEVAIGTMSLPISSVFRQRSRPSNFRIMVAAIPLVHPKGLSNCVFCLCFNNWNLIQTRLSSYLLKSGYCGWSRTDGFSPRYERDFFDWSIK